MDKAAQALGRRAKGVPKTLTEEQRKFRAEQLAEARKKRHIIPPSSELVKTMEDVAKQPGVTYE